MPAVIANDGTRDLFASHREPAWHGLGTVFDEEVTDYNKMLNLAGLNGWNVRKEALVTETGIAVPGHYATVRDSITSDGVATIPMGVVGERYETVQNENAFSILQSLADGARWETAGALGDGSRVFGSLAFERETVLDPNGVSDVVRQYALCVNSHDGSTPFMFMSTPVRVVCQNTLNMAMGKNKGLIKIRHTATADDRSKAAAALWRAEHAYVDAFETEAQTLFSAPFSDKQYENAFTTLFPKPEEDVKGSLTKWENRRGLFMQAWNGSPNAGIKGTAWGAVNALSEANQWGRNMRQGAKGQESFFAAGAGLDGPTNLFRQNALTLVKTRAGIK